MDTRTWIETVAVAVVIVYVLGVIVVWNHYQGPPGDAAKASLAVRLTSSTRLLIVVPAVVFGAMIGDDQWVLAVVAFIAGAVLLVAGHRLERHPRRPQP